MTAATTLPTDVAKAVSAIRRMVTPKFARLQVSVAGTADDSTAEALTLLLNFRPDRCPEAAKAHRVLIKQVCMDLRDDGKTCPEYPKLIAHLYAYLEEYGFTFYHESGRWENHNCPPGETVIL